VQEVAESVNLNKQFNSIIERLFEDLFKYAKLAESNNQEDK